MIKDIIMSFFLLVTGYFSVDVNFLDHYILDVSVTTVASTLFSVCFRGHGVFILQACLASLVANLPTVHQLAVINEECERHKEIIKHVKETSVCCQTQLRLEDGPSVQ